MKLTRLEMEINLLKSQGHDIECYTYTRKNGQRTTYITRIGNDKYTTNTYEQTHARGIIRELMEETIDVL